jgi:hypothetical protein
MSGHIKTAGHEPEPVGWISTASAEPSGVGTVTSVSVTFAVEAQAGRLATAAADVIVSTTDLRVKLVSAI